MKTNKKPVSKKKPTPRAAKRPSARSARSAKAAGPDVAKMQAELDRFRAVTSSTTRALMMVDRNLVVTYVNEATMNLFRQHDQVFRENFRGFDPQNIVGTCIDVFHKNPAHQRAILADPSKLPHSAEIKVGELRFRLNVAAIVDSSGQLVGNTLEWADITELRKKELEVTRLGAAVEGMTTNLMMADADGRITYMNPAVAAMLTHHEEALRKVLPKFSVKTLVGTSIDDFHRNPAHQRAILSDPKKLPYRAQIKVAGLEFGLNATAIIDPQGKLIGNCVEWTDMTEQMDAQRQIEGLIAEAAQGRLEKRVETSRYNGFMKGLGDKINHMLETFVAPMRASITTMDALAHGDLTEEMAGEYQGEFKRLQDAVNGTTQSLRKMVGEIRTSSASIDSSATELSKGNSDLSQRTQEQAASLEETAASLEELASAVSQNTDNARHANQLAAGARQQAEKGGEVVSKAISAMQAISSSSKKISDIIGVIDEIAFQTNLLALNAAVEAARAGEQGRGFAVVAAEVRNLAQRSAAAAKEIKQLIEDSVEKVDEGGRLVNDSGATLQEIVASSKKVSDIIAEIASASEEQNTGIGQVNQAVSQMDSVTQQNAALVEEAAAAAESMNEQARQLIELIRIFRTNEEDEVKAAPPAPEKRSAPAKKPAPAPAGKPVQRAKPKAEEDGNWVDF